MRTNNKLNPHNYDGGSGNRTWGTLVGGKLSHHCTPAPQIVIGVVTGKFETL